eukprot:11032906-Alexandrium_andersonii.AAC.1
MLAARAACPHPVPESGARQVFAGPPSPRRGGRSRTPLHREDPGGRRPRCRSRSRRHSPAKLRSARSLNRSRSP